MTTDDLPAVPEGGSVDMAQKLAAVAPSTRRRIIEKFVLAALGSIPWIGGFLSAAASLKTDEADAQQDNLRTQWLKEHEGKIVLLRQTLEDVDARFQNLGSEIEERIQSVEYLALVRKAFRLWDTAETEEKRLYAANIVVNSAGTRVCSDDVVRLFMDWLARYHEAHFAVIREIFKNPGVSRFEIWSELYGEIPREDSAEADLFKLLMHDLSTGRVVRQERDTNVLGQFVRKRPVRRTGPAPATLKSAFDDTEHYVLTELGKQFVHYTMSEVVGRLDQGPSGKGET